MPQSENYGLSLWPASSNIELFNISFSSMLWYQLLTFQIIDSKVLIPSSHAHSLMGFLSQGYLQRRRVQSFCLWKLILNIIVKTAQVHFRKFVVQLLKSCPTLCNPMDCSTPGLPVLQYLLEFAQTQCPLSQWCWLTISSSVTPFSSCPQYFLASGYFPMSWLFTSGGQSIGASASVL